MEMAETRPVPGNTWCQWYDWLLKYSRAYEKSPSNKL